MEREGGSGDSLREVSVGEIPGTVIVSSEVLGARIEARGSGVGLDWSIRGKLVVVGGRRAG